MLHRAVRVVVVAAVSIGSVAACGGARCAEPAAAANAPNAANAASGDESAVAQTLDGFHDAAARADEERYFASFTGDGVFLGTDATERWTVAAFRAYAHPHFAKGKAWSFRAKRRAITVASAAGIAWFDEDLETPNLGPARGSGVLRRDASGAWKVAQYNLSVPIPNDRFKSVKALIEAPPPATN